MKRLEDAGCAAVVLHSLFEEFAEPLAYFPPSGDYAFTSDAYAEHISRVKQAVRVPVIASLNGRTTEAWLRFA